MAAKTRPMSKVTPKTVMTHTTQASKKPTIKKLILDIVRDVQEPKNRKGISYTAIKNELSHRHAIDTKDNRQLLTIKKALAQAVFKEELIEVTGLGANGSFRMSAEQHKKMAKTLMNVAKVKKTLAKKKRASKEPKTMTPKKTAPKPKTPKKAAAKPAALEPKPKTPKRAAPKPRPMTLKPTKKIAEKVVKKAPAKVEAKKTPAKKAPAEVPAKKIAPGSKAAAKKADQQEDAEESLSGESKSEHDETPAVHKTLPKPTITEGSSDELSASEKNTKLTDYKKIDFGIKEKFNLKIATWNVSGLRALASKNPDYFIKENADIICLNEVKLGKEADVPKEFLLKGYHTYWNIGKGETGVAIYSKDKPMNVTNDLQDTEFADAKRLITAEYEKFCLVATYVVNAGQGLKTLSKRLKWNTAFGAHVAELNKHKPVIICGDFSVSHQEIDLAKPKSNKKTAGFTQEERDGFSNLINSGFVDTFRALYPDTIGAYTFWSYRDNARSNNVGWRLDYFVVSERLMENVKESAIRPEVLGSDHCPIVLFLNL